MSIIISTGCEWKTIFPLVFACMAVSVMAQPDTIGLPSTESFERLLEDYLQNRDDEISFDYNTILENLEAFRENPLNLNTADRESLASLGLLSPIQIQNLINYRANAGGLISILELQAVPGFGVYDIRRIQPFVRVGGSLDDFKMSPLEMAAKGKSDLILRYTRILELQDGFKIAASDTAGRPYAGDPNQYYLRFRHAFQNRLSLGITAEKDRGESFFAGSNTRGFDFYSAHAFLKNQNRWLKAIALGDFAAALGQGLIFYSGFAPGKSSLVTSITRRSYTLRPYTSVNEADFLRGAGLSLSPLEGLELTAFVSKHSRDANLVNTLDTTELEEEALISSLQASGFHRTRNEIADENSVHQFIGGTRIQYEIQQASIAANIVYQQLDKDLRLSDALYNRFRFGGRRLLNGSLDYNWNFRNIYFFGETGWSDNGGFGTLNGALLGLSKTTTLAFLHRHYEPDFQAIRGQPFGETNGGQNETGLYTGIEFSPAKGWRMSGYFDFWRHPWLRFGADAPSRGHEFLGKLSYRVRRKLEVYVQYRYESKERNAPDNDTNIDFLTPNERIQFRSHINIKLTKAIELRTRMELSKFNNQIEPASNGLLLYQDLIYKSQLWPLSLSTRFALFDTDDFKSRIYAYENDVLYAFSIPAYFGSGNRFYFNLRFKPHRNLTLEARFAQTFKEDVDAIGSGLDAIQGNTKSEIKLQLRWRW